MQDDIFFMQRAILQAKKAFAKDEVPVGAIIIDPAGNIISRAHNLVESRSSQTAHAEILAIQKANKKLNSWRLDNCTMYVTLEPCSMCMGLILLSRIKTLVFATESKFYGFKVDELYKCPIIIRQGPCQDEAVNLLKEFFKAKRDKI